MANPSSVLCLDCGNPRGPLSKECPFCGSQETPPLPKKAGGVFTLNLEENLPRVDIALQRFDEALDELSQTAVKIIKVIHGYGSGGRGGKIKESIRQELIYQRRSDWIADYYAGEDLGTGKESYQELCRKYPAVKSLLTKDMLGNPGITLIILKK